MENIFNTIFTAIFTLIFFLLASCGSDDPVIPNEEELITHVTYTLSPTDGGNDVVLTWIDTDGDGNGDITGGTLSTNTTYDGSILLEMKTTNPSTVTDITEEVLEEADEHQFFYQFESTLDASATYADTDANNLPLGILSTVTAGDASFGSLTVVLRHQPDKSATGVSGGDITNAGGSTDLNISFPISIQ